MVLRLTEKQAISRGLISGKSKGNGVKTRKESIIDHIRCIKEARCDVVLSKDGKRALVRFCGITVPSLNEVLRYDLRREFYQINKCWRHLVLQSMMVARPNRMNVSGDERVDIHVHSLRGRLLDADNVCVKSIVDACAKDSILQDDNTDIVGRVTTSQEISKIDMIYVQMKTRVVDKLSWLPDSDLMSKCPDSFPILNKARAPRPE